MPEPLTVCLFVFGIAQSAIGSAIFEGLLVASRKWRQGDQLPEDDPLSLAIADAVSCLDATPLRNEVLSRDMRRWLLNDVVNGALSRLAIGQKINDQELVDSLRTACTLHEVDSAQARRMLDRFLDSYQRRLSAESDPNPRARFADNQRIQLLEGQARLEKLVKAIRNEQQAAPDILTLKNTYLLAPGHERYPWPSPHLNRTASPLADWLDDEMMPHTERERTEGLAELVGEHRHLVVLADAGIGKTKELQHVAAFYSQCSERLVPHLSRLNIYACEDIEDLWPDEYGGIPDSQRLLLLDGFDEVQPQHRHDFERKLLSYAERHPEVRVVVSSRRNFYSESPATLKGFEPFILLDLTHEQSERYISDVLSARTPAFLRHVDEAQMGDLLRIPFYLVRLLDIYDSAGQLPRYRSQIYEQIVTLRLAEDDEHFSRSALEYNKKRDDLLRSLEKLALAMETLGRNHLYVGEYNKLLPSFEERRLAEHSGVWVKSRYQFEHNSIQEFFAARALARLPLDAIKEFIAFPPERKRIKPVWINTLAFLVSISRDAELIDWIMSIEPERLVAADIDHVAYDRRFDLFRRVFEYYRDRQLRLDPERVSPQDLARVAQGEPAARYLFQQVEDAKHFSTISNALSILRYMGPSFPQNEKQRLKETLVRMVCSAEASEVGRTALRLLADFRLNDETTTKTVVDAVVSANDPSVLAGLYYLLNRSSFLEDHIDVLVKGIEYLGFTPAGITMPYSGITELSRALQKVTKPESTEKLLAHFAKHPLDLDARELKALPAILAEKAAGQYPQHRECYRRILDLFRALVFEQKTEAARNIVRFFDLTNTRQNAVRDVLNTRNKSLDWAHLLPLLADKVSLEFLMEEYSEERLSYKEIRNIQCGVKLAQPELGDWFTDVLNDKTGGCFSLPSPAEVDESELRRRDFDVLFDRTTFIHEIESVFEKAGKSELTHMDLFDLEGNTSLNSRTPKRVLSLLQDFADSQGISREECVNWVELNWEPFWIRQAYGRLAECPDLTPTPSQETKLKTWCLSRLPCTDFRTAISVSEDGATAYGWDAIMLWFFGRRLSILSEYGIPVLLDMLSFDYVEQGSRIGIGYLERLLSDDDIRERVLQNLDAGIKSSDVLRNHLDYCTRKKIPAALPYALAILPDTQITSDLRRVAMDLVLAMPEAVRNLERCLPEVTDQFRWDIVDRLIELSSTGCRDYLRSLLSSDDIETRHDACKRLILLNDMEALRLYVDWVKGGTLVLSEYPDFNPLSKLSNIDALPMLLELLEFSYKADDREKPFNTWYNLVIDGIYSVALSSEENLLQTRSELVQFVNEHKELANVNYLLAHADRMENRFYLNASPQSLDDVLEMMKKVGAIA